MANQEYPEQRYVITALLRYILAAVIFVVLVGVFAWFFFFRGTDNTTQTSRPGNDSQGTQTNNGSQSNDGDANNDDNGTATNESSTNPDDQTTEEGAAGTTDSGSSSGNTDAANPDELADTGPGDLVAIFTVAVLAGFAYKYYQLTRREIRP